jgi:carbonic anhydrase/acetyltransferase-like protein (isoleucine patch superfamily)
MTIKHRNIRNIGNHIPKIHKSAFIDDTAVVIGKVSIGELSSLWCNVVARGDVSHIHIGNKTNIQDLTMLHVTHYNPDNDTGDFPLIIGDEVTVGHSCCLHACKIENRVLIGMGSTILDRAIVSSDVIVGAGSLVPPGKILESGYLYLGNPVKQVRKLTTQEIEFLTYSAAHYIHIISLHS